MTISVTLNVVASPDEVRELIEREWLGIRPVVNLGPEFEGQQTTDLVCYDPELGYWAYLLENFLSRKFPRISECLLCGHRWIEQPDEDCDICPGCGEYIGQELT